ncbi:MAG: translation elongation factor Ts [Candidatus Marinimicrobia bacterium]|nr:translation elongation factor Ts [Candidatus Neomarinimicrobiota bacterium]MBL7023243.1 translation elongation factor Ts [Candidatus Neomarinimicrobiota bacterium]MBL7110029.1 translation elongation factor Ts [Candidatus Neomarinimicrobiota bacterium]
MITASAVKELRDRTGAGMMDCKKALQEAEGNMENAVDNLRKSGIAKAQKKAGRSAKDGNIIQYIHPGAKLGVLAEINCETDFAAKSDTFQTFIKDIAMHIAASSPVVVKREDIDPAIVEREKNIFKEQALQSGKPEAIIDRITEGRLEKFYSESVLLEQAFVKDPDKTIKDLLTETIATLGENINITRFVRFELGETKNINGSD